MTPERTDPNAQEEFREDAHRLLQNVLAKNDETENRRVSVIVEFVAGRVDRMLLKMIALYRPDCECPKTTKMKLISALIVGTKGTRSKMQKWGKALGGESLQPSLTSVNSSQRLAWAQSLVSPSLTRPSLLSSFGEPQHSYPTPYVLPD